MTAQIGVAGLGRRALIAGAVTAAAAHSARAAPPLKITVFGQALIQHDLRAHPWPDFARIAAIFGAADVAFTDLETAISGPGAGPPTREGVFAHTAGPEVIDCLQDLGVTMLAQSNNHAFDLNTGGIVVAIEAMDDRRIVHAGTGRNLDAAAAPVYQSTDNGIVGLVAFASGQIREGGAATETRAGVNEARRAPGTGRVTGLNEEDIARVLDAVGLAATSSDATILYHHNHYLEPDETVTPEWQRALARRAIDAGAAMFVSHGVPLLHGIEIYKGQPIFYSLGSLIFQSATEGGHYDAAVWQSVIAGCRFDGRRFLGATLTPVQMNDTGVAGAADLETRGRPSIATGENAAEILARLAKLSEPFGTRLGSGTTDGTAELIV
jgi:poly-gamma-glutamate capsule biosynthesis protein CapA/YwtB (metallophosphatase superfamily)